MLVCSTILTPIVLASAIPANAEVYLWVGGLNSSYETPANWFGLGGGAAYPGAQPSDAAAFGDTANATQTVTIANPATLGAWAFASGASATSYTIDGGQTVNLSSGIINGSTSGTHTIANDITGNGAIIQQGAGSTLVLSGTNTYTGATTVSAGTLRTTVDGALGSSSALTIAAGATLDLGTTRQTVASLAGAGTIDSTGTPALSFGADNSSTSFSGNFTGAIVSLQKQGSGTFTFSGNGGTPAAGGAIEIVGGTVALTGAANVANIGMLLQPAATLDISGTTGGATVLYLSSGPGSAVHLGSRTLTIDYALGFTFNTSSRGVIDGSGGLTVSRDTNLSLYGVNTFTGATTLTTATSRIQVRDGNALATSSEINVAASGATFNVANAGSNTSIRSLRGVAGSNVVIGNDNLIITNAAADFAGVIAKSQNNATGGLVIAGGHQTLSGTNTYTGTTTVNGGTLTVNRSIAQSSMTTVNAGGTLGGTGTVGNTTINGGTLAPGNSIGILTVNGNLVFTAASSYMAEISPATSDFVNVTGTATLGGATVKASFAPGAYVARQYTILNAAGGVVGTFGAQVNTDLPANFTSSLSYDGNHAYLNLALSFVPPSSPDFGGGLTGNQADVARALTNYFNITGGIPLVFGALTPGGLTQIAGETATGAQQTTIDAMTQFIGVMTDPFISGRGDGISAGGGAAGFAEESAYAAADKPRSKSERDAYAAVWHKAPPMAQTLAQRWSVWAAGYGGSQTTDGNATQGTSTATSRIYGTAVGADYRFSANTLAGFAMAGGGTNFNVNGFGSGRSDLFQAGAFIRHNVGPAYLSAALAYGWQDVTTDRTVTVAGVDRLRANFNVNAWSGRAEGGYRFATPLIGLTPYAAGQFTTFELPAYAESVVSGADTFALAYGAKTVTASRSELGLRTDKSFALTDSILTLRGRAAWAHDFNSDRNLAATFQTLPGASFVVNGAAQSRDKALTTASAEIKWVSGFALAATFEGEFGSNVNSYAGKGVARYAW